jgi:hypothetical protein
MGTLLNRVVDVGHAAATGANRLWNIPGNVGRMGTDALENATYAHLTKNAGDRAENLAQDIYMRKSFQKPFESKNANSVFNALRDNEYARLQDRAKTQAALVPGGLRMAGRAVSSPLGMTAMGVGATLYAGNMMEEQALREQLQAMGLSPEEAEILRNEMAAAALQMEPMIETSDRY